MMVAGLIPFCNLRRSKGDSPIKKYISLSLSSRGCKNASSYCCTQEKRLPDAEFSKSICFWTLTETSVDDARNASYKRWPALVLGEKLTLLLNVDCIVLSISQDASVQKSSPLLRDLVGRRARAARRALSLEKIQTFRPWEGRASSLKHDRPTASCPILASVPSWILVGKRRMLFSRRDRIGKLTLALEICFLASQCW